MKSIVINHRAEKEKEGTYYTVPFEVPENVEALTVTYKYNKITQGITGHRKDANIIDLGIMDCDGRFIGWSGSARESVTVGEFSSTKGYFSKPIKSGTWNIIVGAYKICGDFTDIEYTIEFQEKKSRFYFGDLHIHTVASDGQYTAYEIAEKAKKIGLDFVATADHNNYSENFSLPKVDDLTFIPAVEWTHYKGHMNFFGVKAPFENSFIANSHEEMKNLIDKARGRGAVVSVNHPKCTVCPYLWEDEETFDMMEIWNGPMRNVNMNGIKWWTELLSKGRKIPAVGGSDYHRTKSPVKLGNPVNAVYSPSRSAEDLLESIKKGHLYITSSVNGAKLFLKCGSFIMGDTVVSDKSYADLTVGAKNFGTAKIILVTTLKERELTVKDGTCSVTVDRKEKFAYVKAIKNIFGKPMVTAITNPIYLK